jgi:hypothetical protein
MISDELVAIWSSFHVFAIPKTWKFTHSVLAGWHKSRDLPKQHRIQSSLRTI